MNTADVFDNPDGPVLLPDNGRWWINRTSTDVRRQTGTITITVADEANSMTFNGTPRTLRRLAEAIIAQVESAEVNTREEEN